MVGLPMIAVPSLTGGLGIQALLYVVFDERKGPFVLCGDPENVLESQFMPLGRYLMPDKEVKGRVVSIVLNDSVILGMPVHIEDTAKYRRNIFQFNICIVVSRHVDAAPHRDLAQQLALAFRALEVEYPSFLSAEDSDPAMRLQPLLAKLRAQLNETEECFVRVGSSHCIAFRVRRKSLALTAPIPRLCDVVVPLVDVERLLSARSTRLPFDPDWTLLHLVRYLDGVRSVHGLVAASGLSEERTLICIRHLLHFDLVAVIDPIQFQNRYRLTPSFHTAFCQPDIRNDVARYITGGRCDADNSRSLVDIAQGLYADLGNGARLEEFHHTHARSLEHHGISLRHFVAFGLLRGFLEGAEDDDDGDDSRNATDGANSLRLSAAEVRELQQLRIETMQKKKHLFEIEGKTPEEANKDEEIKSNVARMSALRAKEMESEDEDE